MSVGSTEAFGRSTKKQTPIIPELTAIQLTQANEVGRLQIDSIEQQQKQQAELAALASGDIDTLGADADLARARSEEFDPFLDQLRNLEVAGIEAGPNATPEQLAAIEQARSSAFAVGASDIEAGTRRQLEILREELAPSRGLRSTDTPILDRGGRIAEESLRQLGQLTRDLSGRAAEAELTFPLAAGELESTRIRGQQDVATRGQEFQEQLRVAAFQNRLQLGATAAQGGLGLASISPNFVGPSGQKTASSAFQLTSSQEFDIGSAGGAVAASSRTLKHVGDELDPTDALAMLEELPIYRWRYKGDDKLHFGPMAEDFHAITGRGDDKTINLLDTAGLLLAATKGLGLAKRRAA